MFLVHFDEREVSFSSPEEKVIKGELHIELNGLESAKELSGIISSFAENKFKRRFSLISSDLKKSWETFCSLYIILDAAGGIVLNKEKKLLMIYRNEHWDLPKGKIEKGENRNDAALREVTEETGVRNLAIEHECLTTYHIYPFKNKNILKRTYWFRMISEDETTPLPQVDEGITIAEWKDKEEVKKAAKYSYQSVVNLLKAEGLI